MAFYQSIHGRKVGLDGNGALMTEGGALRVPSYPTTELPAAAKVKGGIVFDTTTSTLKYSDGTNYVALTAAT